MRARVALTTGGGVGRAVAAHLAESGWRLALVSRSATRLEGVGPCDALRVEADVFTPDGARGRRHDAGVTESKTKQPGRFPPLLRLHAESPGARPAGGAPVFSASPSRTSSRKSKTTLGFSLIFFPRSNSHDTPSPHDLA
jgi:NAD(P)-dependent dehydrogenase (short-subunit alcohol dehydrogenase family)